MPIWGSRVSFTRERIGNGNVEVQAQLTVDQTASTVPARVAKVGRVVSSRKENIRVIIYHRRVSMHGSSRAPCGPFDRMLSRAMSGYA